MPQCIIDGCSNLPLYFVKKFDENYKDKKKHDTFWTARIFCDCHAYTIEKNLKKCKNKKFMINKQNKTWCNVYDCEVKFACFNIMGTNYGLFCKNCKLADMYDVTSSPCSNCNTRTRGTYKHIKTGEYFCKNCVAGRNIEDFIHASFRRCQGALCKIREKPIWASYAAVGTKKATHCLKCAEIELVDFVDANHIKCKCGKRAYYAFADTNSVTHCWSCSHLEIKEMTMPHKRCNVIDKTTRKACATIKHYNLPGTTIPKTCANCGPPGSIIVTNKQCGYNGCKAFASHGYPDSNPIRCNDCQMPGMIDLYKFNACTESNCKQQYDYLVNGQKKCDDHTPNEFKNQFTRKCGYCNYPYATADYKCPTCRKNKKRIEQAIVDEIRKQPENYEFKHDKPLSKLIRIRPDMLFEIKHNNTIADSHIKSYIIVEIDEEDHRKHTFEEEVARIRIIHEALGAPYLAVIRFNPDVIIDKITKKKIDTPPEIRFNRLLRAIKKYHYYMKNGRITYSPEIFRYKQLYCETISDYYKKDMAKGPILPSNY
jgi:hypothetical protein